jgi:hypothetical protein
MGSSSRKTSEKFYVFSSLVNDINLLKSSGNFTYHQV